MPFLIVQKFGTTATGTPDPLFWDDTAAAWTAVIADATSYAAIYDTLPDAQEQADILARRGVVLIRDTVTGLDHHTILA